MFAKKTALLLAVLLPCAAALATDARQSLKLTLRSRVPIKNGFEVVHKIEVWDPKQTAIIVCDMWDQHHCLNAALRVKELAPCMNELLSRLRTRGVLIVHAPSSCMPAYR